MANSSRSTVGNSLDLICNIVRNIDTHDCTPHDVMRLHILADTCSQLAQAWEHEVRELALEEQAIERWELAERFGHDINAAFGK